MIRLENTKSGHNKFYELYHDPESKKVSIRYGAIGSVGTIQTKSFSSANEAEIWASDQRYEKGRNGYVLKDEPSETAHWRRVAESHERALSEANKALYRLDAKVRGVYNAIKGLE